MAIRARDVNRVLSSIARDALLFDVVNPLQARAVEASRQRRVAWFDSFEGPIGVELRDLTVTATDDIAFSHGLNRYSGTRTGE